MQIQELQKNINENINKTDNLIYGNNKYRTGYAWKLDNAEEIYSNKYINGKLSFWDIDINDVI